MSAGIKLTPEMLNDPAALRRFQEAQTQLSGALSRLLVTVERYPELKSNQNFLTLQSQLESLENRIAVERRRFNETVAGLQHRGPALPRQPRGVLPRLRREALLRGHAGQRNCAKVKF